MSKLKGRDFISLLDYSREDIETILNLAFELKRKLYAGEPHLLLPGKNLGMMFWNPSTRTRISFETAMTQLGGHAQYYSTEATHANIRENWVDTAQVVSRYLDGLMIRLFKMPPSFPTLKYGEARQILETLADNASIPIINAMDDEEHPCQTMADMMTIIEKMGPDYREKKTALVWAPHGWYVPPSVAGSHPVATATLGMNLTIAYPPGFDLDPKYLDEAKKRAEESGGTIQTTNSLDEACKNADVIYNYYWGAITGSDDDEVLRKQYNKEWCLAKKHFDIANKNAIFMNPMPLQRGVEVTAEVVDGPMSVIYDEAENRLHAQKAILSLIMG